MREERDPATDEIIALLANTCAIDATKVTPHSRLASDLGVDGDDAHEFLEAFVARFGVDFSNFYWLRYFGDEGLDAFAPTVAVMRQALSTETRRRWRAAQEAEREITIAHLANVAEAKRWIEPGPEAAPTRPTFLVRTMQTFLAVVLPLPFVALTLVPVLSVWFAPSLGALLGAGIMLAFLTFLLWISWRNVTRKLESSPR